MDGDVLRSVVRPLQAHDARLDRARQQGEKQRHQDWKARLHKVCLVFKLFVVFYTNKGCFLFSLGAEAICFSQFCS